MQRTNWTLKQRIAERWGSQINFAWELGVNEAFVSRVVKGRQKISDDLKKAWAERLGAKVSEIFPEA